MSIAEIESAIKLLPPKELADLTKWVVEYHHQMWDQQIANDLEAGRLDDLIAEAEEQYKAGLSRPL